MIGHLGVRISALLDGQLSCAEEERAWAHVHACHLCRDLVEREGWIKTRLAGLSPDSARASTGLKGALLAGGGRTGGLTGSVVPAMTPGDAYLVGPMHDPRSRWTGLAVLGSGAAGAAVMGVLALGAAPADAPTLDRPVPTTTIINPFQIGFGTQQRSVPTP